ncbi:MAG: hypothetical protein IJZ47_08035 [Oscillospiraceae bacterium]|nr:hypothetical protein [Oscillospiraceae bacterium]
MSETTTTYGRTVLEFADGTVVETPIAPLGGTATHQSAYRHTMEYRIPYDAITFEQVEALYTNAEAMAKVNLTEHSTKTTTNSETGEIEKTEEVISAQSQYLNFTMPMELTLKTINDIKVWCVKMAQMSDVEITQAQQAEEIELTQAALVEALAMIGG